MEVLRRILAAVCLLLMPGWVYAQELESRAGLSIYRDGLLPSGQPVSAMVQNGVVLSGARAACVNCHRRSGLGGSEGQSRIRPIAGRLLFSSSHTELARRWAVPAGTGVRPAYTGASLARALREGVDPNGRALDPLMPRYALSDEEIGQLHVYLESMSPSAAPGVTEHDIHFATIIAPSVDLDKRRAQLDVLQTFVRDKNSGTRSETRRRQAGAEWMYLGYRKWVLHVWELEGPPQTWGEQLEARYLEQPVFAVLGGLGSGPWQPVHAFCEQAEVPCIFPDVDYPAQHGGYYTVYFSRGLALEAEVLAAKLAQDPQVGRIVQVFRDDERGRLPAHALRKAALSKGIAEVTDHPVMSSGPLPAAFWAQLLREAQPTTLIVWLDPADVQSLGYSGPPPAGLRSVYLSASLSSMQDEAPLHRAWLDRARMVWLFDPPAERERHLVRLKSWLRARKIPPGDPRTQANAYFAAAIAGEAITYLGDNFSRDYFIERIEQMAEADMAPSMYPRLSLGPGQRFASRGGYILRFAEQGAPAPVSDWLVP